MTSPLVARSSLRSTPLPATWLQLARRPHAFLLENRERYGEIYRLNLGRNQMIVLNHPRHAQHVLRDNARLYHKGGPIWESLRRVFGNGLAVVEDGPLWLRQRRMMQPHFHRHSLAALTDQIVDAIEGALGPWEKAAESGKQLEALAAFKLLTLNVVVRAIFGSSLSPQAAAQMGEDVAVILDSVLPGMLSLSLPGWLPLPGKVRYEQAMRRMDRVMGEVIARRRSEATPAEDLLSMLVRSVDDETNEQMTDEQLRAEILILFVAGLDTTAVGLAWAIDFLTHYPDAALRLREEVAQGVGSGRPTYDDLASLPYTRMVVQETLRLRPPSWWVPRIASVADEIDGVPIPAGSTVLLLTYVIHHHPDMWAHPHGFYPEHFAQPPRHKLAWIPFGTGPRQCIGKELTLLEMPLALAMLAQRYLVTAASPHPATPGLKLDLRPSTVPLHVHRL